MSFKNINFLQFQRWDAFAQIPGSADACFVTIWAGLENFALLSRTFIFLSAGYLLINLMATEAEVPSMMIETSCVRNMDRVRELVSLNHNLLLEQEALHARCTIVRQTYSENLLGYDLIKH